VLSLTNDKLSLVESQASLKTDISLLKQSLKEANQKSAKLQADLAEAESELQVESEAHEQTQELIRQMMR
jgi:septal ring factor EnvC (AmiA/AmiB activator)